MEAGRRGREEGRKEDEQKTQKQVNQFNHDGMGAPIYDVRKMLGFFEPLPPSHVHKSADFVPFICFLGTPSHCGRHIWKPQWQTMTTMTAAALTPFHAVCDSDEQRNIEGPFDTRRPISSFYFTPLKHIFTSAAVCT